ncbi:hypothetical protein [Methanococcus maripaludis]|uniref:Uncharacterized protein n=1 Tax=Methanococcus maripaludis TaxID=39152 RepID=A0A7J9PNQ7_METMI|nr:hypothetical protein [Methanococcus maripaludis]MBA2864448.1 hypothetical protein [Methanococcus maripaludis]
MRGAIINEYQKELKEKKEELIFFCECDPTTGAGLTAKSKLSQIHELEKTLERLNAGYNFNDWHYFKKIFLAVLKNDGASKEALKTPANFFSNRFTNEWDLEDDAEPVKLSPLLNNSNFFSELQGYYQVDPEVVSKIASYFRTEKSFPNFPELTLIDCLHYNVKPINENVFKLEGQEFRPDLAVRAHNE